MKRHKKPKIKLNPTQQLVAAAGIFVLSVILSRPENISYAELSLFNYFYELPKLFFWPLLVITQLGSMIVLLVIAAAFLIRKRFHIGLRLLLTGSLAYLLSGVAKDLWGRGRPFDLLDNITSLDLVVRGSGFPSGHVALATALALTLGHYLPKKYYWLVFFIIGGVSLSRIYLGVHLPLDLLGGFAIGWFAYALFRHVKVRDIYFKNRSKKRQ